MKITVVGFSDIPQSVTDFVALAARALVCDGFEIEYIEVPRLGLPRTIPTEHSEILRQLTLTPGALVESWRVARHLDALTQPGDVVLISDHRGRGGMFALEQALGSSDTARDVWTLAGAATSLASLDAYRTLIGTRAEAEAEIDWEVVQYRFSSRVIAMCNAARDTLASMGITIEMLEPVAVKAGTTLHDSTSVIAVPEPVSRRAHSLDVMRAVTEYLDTHSNTSVVVTVEDTDDVVWLGSTWDAVPGKDRFGGRVTRSETPCEGADVIILGDPFRVPSEAVIRAHQRGVPVIAAAGSLAGAILRSAYTWDSVDDLAEILEGLGPIATSAVPMVRVPLVPAIGDRETDPTRARRVSVGIPIYGNVEYLDACVASVVGQTVRPHEIVLYDDGSDSPVVSSEIERLVDEHHGLVRSLSGPNRGVCVARNALIDAFTGDAFVLLDSDDLIEPQFIEACVEAMRARPRIGAVATWTVFFGGYEGIEARPPFDARIGLRENPIVSTAVLITRDAWDLGISFAEDMAFLYCEDWHVWSQLIAAGVEFGLVPRPLVRHRVHATSGATRRSDVALAIGTARATEPLRGEWVR